MLRGRHTRTLTLALVVTLAGAGCARPPEGAAEAIKVRCPEGSDCYDPPKALGDGGMAVFESVDFAFTEVAGGVSQGDITVELDNLANGEHNIVFVGANTGSEKIVAGGNSNAEGVVNLFTGDYTYFCDIPGHRASGMEGTLTVYATPELAAENAPADPSGGVAANEDTDVSNEAATLGTEAATESSDGSLEDPDNESVTAPSESESATEQPTVEAGEKIDADDVDEDTIASLDDSDDIEAALADKGFARAYELTFSSGSDELESGADDVLDQLEALLNDDEDLNLRIEGNTDSDGDADVNDDLSNRRAAAVVAELIDRGIDAKRLSAVGNGEDNLLVENEQNNLAKRVNRRVEIYVVQ